MRLLRIAVAAAGLAIVPGVRAQITSPLYHDELDRKINLAINSLRGYWLTEFSRLAPNKPYVQIDRVYPYDTLNIVDPTGRCGPRGLNAFYCPSGDAILYERPHFMGSLLNRVGDFSVAVVLAHEWGHGIQQRLASTRPRRANAMDYELEADCFAGSWAKYVDEEDPSLRLEDGDLDEAVLGVFGSRDPSWLVWADPRAHGSGLQRVEAFLAGYRGGATRCLGPMPPPFRRRG